MTGLRQAKDALRTRMRAERAGLGPTEREERTARIEERLLALPEVAAARTAFVFASFGSEVATEGIRERLAGSGVRVLLPYVRERVMEASEAAADVPLRSTGSGPPEPFAPQAVDPAEIDVVIAPGLAFDREGGRVGYGRGHYDRFLARLGPATVRIGVAFDFQVVDRAPTGPGDEPVDVVVTDREVIRAGKASPA